MAHPSEYYIKFLLAKSWGDEENQVTLESLNATLQIYDLPFLQEQYYDHLMLKFQPPTGFRFHSKKNEATREFMKDEGITTLWEPRKDDKRVMVDIVDGDNQLAKHTVQLLLMGDVPAEVIADKTNTKFHINPAFTARMVETYRHFFWNVNKATFGEWETHLEGHRFRDAYLACLHCGDQQALFRAGFRPKVDSRTALADAQRDVYFRLRNLFWKPDDKFIFDTLTRLSGRLSQLHELMKGEGAGAEDQLKKFKAVLMEHTKMDTKTVDDIVDRVRGGSISGDGSEGDQKDG
jgi:hypothetical protein